MAAPCFTDEKNPPTEKDILAAVGRAGGAWRALFDRIHSEHPDLEETWRYYADGKSWLLKVSRRSSTVFWLSVEQGAFRITFYFPERVRETLLESGLSEQRKAEVRARAPSGKLRGVSVTFGPERGMGDVMTLIALKRSLR